MTDKAAEISNLLAPTVESLGVELLGIEYLPGSGGATLRLYIDVPAGEADQQGESRLVSIEDCEAVSREVSAQLDVEDPISGNYTLEVSSPGIDRPLFNLEHFKRFQGETAKVTLKLPQEGRRRLTGRIERVEGSTIVFVVDGAEIQADIENIDKARLVPDWAALGLEPVKPGKPGAGKARANKNQTENPTNKPASDDPTPVE